MKKILGAKKCTRLIATTLLGTKNNLQSRIDELNYRQHLKPQEVTPEVLKSFCASVANKLNGEDKAFAKEYLKVFVKEIIIDVKQVKIVGNAATIASSVDEKKVPSIV